MENAIPEFTYPITYEIELDALHFLYESEKSRRFKEIMIHLLSQEKYKARYSDSQGIKPLLVKALKSLVSENILRQTKKSRKWVSYRIKNKTKAKRQLKLRHGELFQIDKQTNKLLYKDIALNDFHWRFTLDFSLLLLEYEKILCEAIANDDISSFVYFQKGLKSSLLALLETLITYLSQRTKLEIKEFYTESLKDTDSSDLTVGLRRAKTTNGKQGSWIKAWKANHQAEVSFYSYLLNSFKECLERVGGQLRLREGVTEEQIIKNAIKGLEILKARKLKNDD